jgi:hypothetical protein
MKKYIKSSSSAYGWWNQYYNDMSIEEACKETNQTPEELIAEYQEVADSYGYTFRGLLEAKPEYFDNLDELWCISKYTDERGNLVVGLQINDRLYTVDQQEVLDKLTSDEDEMEEDPLSAYEDQGFSVEQLEEIQTGLMDGLDVSVYADPKYDFWQMREIRRGLKSGVDVSQYADPKFNGSQMFAIRKDLEDKQ